MAGQAAALKRRRKDGRHFNPAHKNKLAAQLRERQALDLRLKGFDYEEIGRKLKISGAGAYKILMRVLDRWKEEFAEKIPQVRQVEIQRCDMMLRALGKGIKQGDTKSIQTALKVAERRARLLGLDAPVKVNPVDDEGRTMDLIAFRAIVLAAEVNVQGLDDVPELDQLEAGDGQSVN
jgi:DNA-binding CsgD family transcriptional regulator